MSNNLSSLVASGGQIGDKYTDADGVVSVIERVISDTNYVWRSLGDIAVKVYTLDFVSGTPGEGEFTHDYVSGQDTVGDGVFIQPITVVKKSLGDGTALVKMFVDVTYLQYDPPLIIDLAPGTVDAGFYGADRAFKTGVGITSSTTIGARVNGVDQLRFDRDNGINGNGPIYFILEGIGPF